jgi:hypothetical protein
MCQDEEDNPQNPNYRPVDPLFGKQEPHPIPCKRHGDPRICLPGNRTAITIFLLLCKHQNFNFREEGKKLKRYLDLSVCAELCKGYGVDIPETLDKLDRLYNEINNG